MKVVLVSAPAEAAERIAGTLVSERLAACVGLSGGLRSVYRWKGAVERADEVQLVVKTGDAAFARMVARLREIHPYEVPEIVAIDPAWVLPEYARWADEETTS